MHAGQSLAGKTFAITGAGSGIGRAIAVACAREGANLCIGGRSLSKLRETEALIGGESGGSVISVELDIASEESIAAFYGRALDRFGTLDGLVANAGIMVPSPPVQDLGVGQWRASIDINLMGTVMTVSQGARILVDQGRGGSILATGSSLVLRPAPSSSSYVTSKAAIHAFMSVAALDLAPHRIRVNTLVPGTSATPPLQAIPGFLEQAAAMVPLREAVSPEELGVYVAFVLSDALPHMTGSALVVDSGRSIG